MDAEKAEMRENRMSILSISNYYTVRIFIQSLKYKISLDFGERFKIE